MASSGVQMIGEKVRPVYAAPVPEFQALPSSIITASIVQPTKVEFYPKDDLPQVDLKGHSVEELAAAANVSVDVIQAAIKLRQQQMMFEKKKIPKQKLNKSTASVQTTLATTTSEPTKKVTIQTTTQSTTTPYVPKKKVVKKATQNGHKVSSIIGQHVIRSLTLSPE